MEYFFNTLADAFIPVSIVVVLPIVIVWLVTRCRTNRDDKNAEILMKAVENNSVQDVDKILVGLRTTSKTRSPQEVMLVRLLWGCIFSFIGIPLIIAGLIMMITDSFYSDAEMFMLIGGAISLSVGVAYLVVYRVSRKMLFPEEAQAKEETED